MRRLWRQEPLGRSTVACVCRAVVVGWRHLVVVGDVAVERVVVAAAADGSSLCLRARLPLCIRVSGMVCLCSSPRIRFFIVIRYD